MQFIGIMIIVMQHISDYIGVLVVTWVNIMQVMPIQIVMVTYYLPEKKKQEK